MAKYVNTNMGLLPVDEYLDIRAIQEGFESYRDMCAQGYKIEIEETVDVQFKGDAILSTQIIPNHSEER